MNKIRQVLLVAAVSAICLQGLSSQVWAVPVLPGGGVWSPTPANPNNDQQPYLDGASYDCADCNILHLVKNITDLDYLHDGSGQAVRFGFSQTAESFNFIYEVTARKIHNTFGWYDLDNPSVHGTIFSGSDGPGMTVTASIPNVNIGFWYNPGPGFPTFYSGHFGYDQFGLLRKGNTYGILIEDIWKHEKFLSDGDFQDAVITFHQQEHPEPPQPVPEPTSFLLLGTGLLGAIKVARHSRK